MVEIGTGESMTTIEDGVAELLANPLEGTVHRQVVDRACEESPDPRRALLDLVLAHKSSDGPRLAYATYCELNGDPERGEFIRVQCELARVKPHADPKLGVFINEDGGLEYHTPPAFYVYQRLERRERELIQGHGTHLGAFFHDLFNKEWRLRQPGQKGFFNPFQLSIGKEWYWERGFVNRVEMPAIAWIAHADAILAEHPVEKVMLRTIVPVEYAIHSGVRVRARLYGLPKSTWDMSISSWNERNEQDRSGIARVLLERTFPGIAFELSTATLFHDETV